jgi:hypothetical protein
MKPHIRRSFDLDRERCLTPLSVVGRWRTNATFRVVELVTRGELTSDQGVLVARSVVGGNFDEARFDADVLSQRPDRS